jgi:hypothetical protein|tara:strand:- start:10184 stop:11116 length:933 start_codon:yes stop_codon:yes gene_type:complete
MIFKCKACDQEFETERKLHSHLKKHDLRIAAYYQKYCPRYDLHDGKIIKFKSKEYYLNTQFNTKTNQLKWLDKLPEKEAKDYLKKILTERKEKKGLVYSPCQVELRSLACPSIISFEKKFNDYYDLCKSLGFKNKYQKIQNITTGSFDKDCKVYIDSREQLPLKFNLPTEVKGLKFGDYALSEKSLTCNCYIERKSLADFISTISVLNYDRFCREIERAAENDANLIIVIDDTLTNALSFPFLPYISKKIRVTPEFIFHKVRGMIQKYDHIQFLFVKGRKESVRVIEKIFFSKCIYKKIDLQLSYDKKIL